MALSTSGAPLYGGSTLVIELSADTALTTDASYYLLYEGSKQRHLTTARLVSPCKLHSIIPGHNDEEAVRLNVIEFHGNVKTVLSSYPFHFYKDGAFYLSQFLIESVFSTDALDDLELINSDNFNLADEELSTLDTRLSRALTYHIFPEWWSLVGADTQHDIVVPRESLLHFAARLGLNRVAAFLLHKAGSEQILKLHNKNGQLPRDVAIDNGHSGLAELLSEYNIHSLMPLGRLLETEDGVIQTADSGDVTLTSKLETHHRTIEEDIIVLQGIHKQLENEDVDISRQWQTDWPAESNASDTIDDTAISADDKYKTICEKVQELPNVLTLETINDYRDNTDAYVDPSIEQLHCEDHVVDMSEDCDVAGDMEPLTVLHVSESEEDCIMEGTLSALRGYNEHLLRIRQKSNVFNKILEQDLRKENLARFSTSCPSLDVEYHNSPLPVIDEAELCKSMVDLVEENAGETSTTPSSMYSGDVFSSSPDVNDSSDNIHIVVDAATTDGSSEFGLQSREYDRFLNNYYGGNVAQVRNRSPLTGKSDSVEDQDCVEGDSMLIHGNKSVGFTAADDEPVDDSFRSHDDASLSDRHFSAGIEGSRSVIHSAGDIVTQPEKQSSRVREDEGIAENSVLGSGRGQANKARYSADIEYMMKNFKGHHSGSSLDKMSWSTHSTGSATDNEMLAMPPAKITKAFSMSSIPAAMNNDKHKGSGYKDGNKHAHFHRQEAIQEDDIAAICFENNRNIKRQKPKPQLSLLDFLNDPANFSNVSSNMSSPKPKDKEDKKRKTSMFSRFHSTRIKKNKDKEKDGKSKASTHRFVSVSFSNATTCDVCRKPLTNKPALRCQICLVNLHENSCKEHIPACDKFKTKSQLPKQSSAECEAVPTSQERSSAGVSNLRPSYSFKENSTRAQSTYGGASTQPIPLPGQPESLQLQSASARLERRSLPSPSHPIVEEDREADHVSRLDLGTSNITEAISHSIESLDDVDGVQEVRYDDVELGRLDVPEPETWSETVDKKVLKKLNPKDIKRQDTIWELIQTERTYCKRLKTLQRFFRDGMVHQLRMSSELVERLFPQLDDLIIIHMSFLCQLQELQNKRHDRFVEEIGPTLKEQFSGESSDQMKASYGVFCSGHLDAVQLYKELMLERKKFQLFIKARTQHPLCRKREIPDFILLITQRPTKYPILIEAVIKSTKDKKDRECLLKALELSKDVLQSVNVQVAAAERAMRLKDIFNRLDTRSFAIHRGKKFRKQDMIANSRVLLHEGMVGWKNARGKSADVLAVVMNDVLFFLQENNQKYSFFSHDNKYGVVSLFNLLVREKQNTRDAKGMYLISQNKQNPEMYEIVFNTATEMRSWAKILRMAVETCPEEEEEVPTENEEERRRAEERVARAQTIMDRLQEKDIEIRQCCDAKNRLMLELLAVYNDTEDQQHHVNSRPSSRDFEESTAENAGLLQAAIQEVSIAASQLTTMLQGNGTNLSRSVSSVGEHSSKTFTAVPIPKRADTFAGFDSNFDLNRVKIKSSDEPDNTSMGGSSSVCKEQDSSDPELNQYLNVAARVTGQKNSDSEGESGRGSSPSCYWPAMLPVSNQSQDQSHIAHLLRTLNSIVYLTASQGTAVETLRAQLAEANERINKLSVDVHEKKSGYKHSQLEELRNLQGVIQKEKEDWELKKTRENRDMEQERSQLDEFKRNLDKQETDLRQQKDEFNKKREVLQRQMDLLRQSGQLPKDTSLSDIESTDKTDDVQTNSDFVPGHRRSASAESFNSNNETKKPGPSATKENNFRPEHKSVSKLQSFSFGSKQTLPVHLLSATNEQKMGSKSVQQLPSKLLAAGSLSTSPQQTSQQTPQTGHRNCSPGSISQGYGNQSPPSLPLDYSVTDQDISMSHSSSAGHIINQGTNPGQLGTGVAGSKGNWQSNRPKQSSKSAGIGGIMKLAEKGDKKGKTSSSSHLNDKGAQSSSQQRPKSGTPCDRNPNIMHKSQKSDSDVIYF